MLITKNPTKDKVEWLIGQSEQKIANWLRDLEDGDLYYWPAGYTSHDQMVQKLQLREYEKGSVA